MPNQSTLEEVRQSLIGAGYNPPEYAEFEQDMQDDGALEEVRMSLKNAGFDPPEFDEFKADMGLGDAAPQPSNNGGTVVDQAMDANNRRTGHMPLDVQDTAFNGTSFGAPAPAWVETSRGKMRQADFTDEEAAALAEERQQLNQPTINAVDTSGVAWTNAEVANMQNKRKRENPNKGVAYQQKESWTGSYARTPDEFGEMHYGWQRGERMKRLNKQGVEFAGYGGHKGNQYYNEMLDVAERMNDDEIVATYDKIAKAIGPDTDLRWYANTDEGYIAASQLKALQHELHARDLGFAHDRDVENPGMEDYAGVRTDQDVADLIDNIASLSPQERDAMAQAAYNRGLDGGVMSVEDQNTMLAVAALRSKENGRRVEENYRELQQQVEYGSLYSTLERDMDNIYNEENAAMVQREEDAVGDMVYSGGEGGEMAWVMGRTVEAIKAGDLPGTFDTMTGRLLQESEAARRFYDRRVGELSKTEGIIRARVMARDELRQMFRTKYIENSPLTPKSDAQYIVQSVFFDNMWSKMSQAGLGLAAGRPYHEMKATLDEGMQMYAQHQASTAAKIIAPCTVLVFDAATGSFLPASAASKTAVNLFGKGANKAIGWLGKRLFGIGSEQAIRRMGENTSLRILGSAIGGSANFATYEFESALFGGAASGNLDGRTLGNAALGGAGKGFVFGFVGGVAGKATEGLTGFNALLGEVGTIAAEGTTFTAMDFLSNGHHLTPEIVGTSFGMAIAGRMAHPVEYASNLLSRVVGLNRKNAPNKPPRISKEMQARLRDDYPALTALLSGDGLAKDIAKAIKTKGGKANADERLKAIEEEYRRLKFDNNVPWGVVRIAEYVVNGRVIPQPWMMNCDIRTDGDGNEYGVTLDGEGRTIEEYKFRNEKDRDKWRAATSRQCDINRLNVAAQNMRRSEFTDVLESTINEIAEAQGMEVAVLRDVVNGGETKDKAYQQAAKEVRDAVDAKLKSTEDPADVAIRTVENKYGISIEQALEYPVYQRTEREARAVEELQQRLNGDYSPENDMSDAELLENEQKQSHDDGYQAEGEQLAEVKERLENAAESLGQMGVNPEEIDKMDNAALAQWMQERDMDAETAAAVMEYQNAKAAFEGVRDRINDDSRDRIEESNQQTDDRTNKKSGMLHRVSVKPDNENDPGREAYVIDGKITINEDGTVDLANSDKEVVVAYTDGSKPEMRPIEDVLNGERPIDPKQVKEETATAITEEVAGKAVSQMNRELAFNDNDTFTILAGGKPVELTVVGHDPETGDPIVQDAQGNQQTVTPKVLQEMHDEWRESQRKPQRVETPAEETPLQNNGPRDNAAPNQERAERSAAPAVGGDPAERVAWYRVSGKSEQRIEKEIANNLETARQRLADAQKAWDETKETDDAALDALERELNEARNEVDYWEKVEQYRKASQEPENAEAEPRASLEGRDLELPKQQEPAPGRRPAQPQRGEHWEAPNKEPQVNASELPDGFNEADRRFWSREGEDVVEMMDEAAKQMGLSIVTYDDPNGENGYIQNGVIYLNSAKGRAAVSFVMGHEMTHEMQRREKEGGEDGKVYTQFRELALAHAEAIYKPRRLNGVDYNTYKDYLNARLEQYQEHIRETTRNRVFKQQWDAGLDNDAAMEIAKREADAAAGKFTMDDILDETAADVAGSMLANPDMAREVLGMEQDLGRLARYKQAFMDWLEKTLAKMTGRGEEYERMKQLEQSLQDLWRDAVRKNRGDQTQDQDRRYSLDTHAQQFGLRYEKSEDGITHFYEDLGRDADGNPIRGREITTFMPVHIENSPVGAVLKQGLRDHTISKEQYDRTIKNQCAIMQYMKDTKDLDMFFAVSGAIGFAQMPQGGNERVMRDYYRMDSQGRAVFVPYKSNSETQYGNTFDVTTICRKTQTMIDVMSETMKAQKHGLTVDEVIKIVYDNVYKMGKGRNENGRDIMVPCNVCYVFNRWVNLGNLFDTMRQLRDRYSDMSTEQIKKERIKNIQALCNEYKKQGNTLEFKKYADYLDQLNWWSNATNQERAIDKANGDKIKNRLNDYGKKVADLMKTRLAEVDEELNALTFKLFNYERAAKKADAEKFTAADRKRMEQLKDEKNYLEKGTWFDYVRLQDDYKPIPDDILFDINRSYEFKEHYAGAWKYRTTRGSGMGKAAAAYSPEYFGSGIVGAAKDADAARDMSENLFMVREPGEDGKWHYKYIDEETWELKPEAVTLLRKAQDKAAAQNYLNGQRFQSTSDARVEYLTDYNTYMLEQMLIGSKGQGFTKVPECAKLFGDTGTMFNLSLIAKGKGYEDLTQEQYDALSDEDKRDCAMIDGVWRHALYSDVSGINHGDAFALSDAYANLQPIMVTINNIHARLCMALASTGRITFNIPYHASGDTESYYLSKAETTGDSMDMTSRADYSDYETDKVIDASDKVAETARSVFQKIKTGADFTKNEMAYLQSLDHDNVLRQLYMRFRGEDVDGSPARILNKYLLKKDRNTAGAGYGSRDSQCRIQEWDSKTGEYLTDADGNPVYKQVKLSGGKDGTANLLMTNDYWDRTLPLSQADRNGEAFLELCQQLGYRPRFSGWKKDKKKGWMYNPEFDFTKDTGYWSNLIDISMYDQAGNPIEQGSIDASAIGVPHFKKDEMIQLGGRTLTPMEANPNIGSEVMRDIVRQNVSDVAARRAKEKAEFAQIVREWSDDKRSLRAKGALFGGKRANIIPSWIRNEWDRNPQFVKEIAKMAKLSPEVLEKQKAKNIEAALQHAQDTMDEYYREGGETDATPQFSLATGEWRLSQRERDYTANVLKKLRGAGVNVQLATDEEARRVLEAAEQADRELMRGWHGSAADFDEFDHSHMGEGEGAQAYGWGTYITEVEGIARTYAKKAGSYTASNNTYFLRRLLHGTFPYILYKGKEVPDRLSRAFKVVSIGAYKIAEQMSAHSTWTFEQAKNEVLMNDGSEEMRKEVDALNPKDFERDMPDISQDAQRKPILYEVDIPENDGSNYLSYNQVLSEGTSKRLADAIKPLYEETRKNREKYIAEIAAIREPAQQKFGDDWLKSLPTESKDRFEELIDLQTSAQKKEADLRKVLISVDTGDELRRWQSTLEKALGKKGASEFLNGLGYVGIEYPAQFRSGGRIDNAKNYVIFNEADAKIVNKTEFLKTSDGTVYGWHDNEGIHLTEAGLNPNTPMHEYTHGLMAMLKEREPEKYQQIVEALKDSEVWQEVLNDKLYSSIRDDEDAVASEVASRLSGRESERRANESMPARIKRAIQELWDAVAEWFGVKSPMTADRISRMTLRELERGTNPDGTNPDGPKGGVRFSLAEDEERTLMGMHNITADKLRSALKLGGLANPSMAVIDTKVGGFTNFGEISLIPGADLIASRSGGNAGTWGSDAYSPRFPETHRRLGKGGDKKMRAWVKGLKMRQEMEYNTEEQFNDYYNGFNIRDNALVYPFLHEKGLSGEVDYYTHKNVDSRLEDDLREANGDQFVLLKRFDEDEEYKKKLTDIVIGDEVGKIHKKEGESFQEFRDRRREWAKQIRDGLTGEDGYINRNLADDLLYTQARAYRENGKFSESRTISNAEQYIRDHGMEEEYQQYFEQKMQELGTEMQVYAGSDSQGRSKYKPVNLEQVSKQMKKQGRAGGEGGIFADSPGAIRAKLLTPMKTLDQIRKGKDRIVNHEQFEKAREEYQDKLREYADIYAGGRMGALADILAARNMQATAKQYGIDLDTDAVADLNRFKDYVKKLPTEYFETKFERPVGLNEFKKAVIPDNLPLDLQSALRRAGLEVVEYPAGDNAARERVTLDAVRNDSNILFSLSEEQREAQTHSANFKKWFGDWERDPQNASKVVDEEGRPLVVYHGGHFGQPIEDYDTYTWDADGAGGWFSANREYSNNYRGVLPTEDGRGYNYLDPIRVYLNIRNPFELGDNNGYIIEGGKPTQLLTDVANRLGVDEKTITDMIDWDFADSNNDAPLFTINRTKAFADLLKSKGFDGAHAIEFGNDTYMITDPHQIKSATDNNGDFSRENPDIRFSLADPFYSNAARAVEGVKQEKAKAEQWKAMLTKAGGIKAGEDKWMGLSTWLDEHKGETLTKEEVRQFVADNGIQMEEVNYSDNNTLNLTNPQRGRLNAYQREFSDLLAKNNGNEEAAMDDMVASHGEDFSLGFWVNDGRLEPVEDFSEGGALDWIALHYLGQGNNEDNTNYINATRLKYTTDGLDNNREIAFVVPGVEPYQESDDIHFGPENQGRAIMWVRFGETTDTDGNRVLVIDEIQSNRHQDAREKGYADPKAVKAFNDWMDAKAKEFGVQPYQVESRLSDEEYHKMMELANAAKYDEGAVPAAPFEKNWHEVAMKRMLRLAAEEGFDKVAWTTGAQQADRYDLSKMVDKIEYAKNEDGTYYVASYRTDGETIQSGNLTPTEVKEYYGNELAQKIANNESNETREAVSPFDKNQHRTINILNGDGLKVGGSGMKGFYDNMLPQFMNKYGKRWGVKVGEVTLDTPGKEVMHSVDVNDDMKRSVMEQGQPLFSLSDDVENYQPESSSWERSVLERVLEHAGREDATREQRNEAVRSVNRSLADLFHRMTQEPPQSGDTDNLGFDIARVTHRSTTAQRKYDRWTVDSLVSMAKSMLKSGMYKGLSPYEVTRLVGKINEGAGRDEIQKQMNTVFDVLMNANLKGWDDQLRRLMTIPYKRINQQGVRVMGRVDDEGARMLQALNNGMELTQEALANKIAEVSDRLGSDNDTEAKNAANELEGLLLAQQYEDLVGKYAVDNQDIKDQIRQQREKVYIFWREEVIGENGMPELKRDGTPKTVEKYRLKPEFGGMDEDGNRVTPTEEAKRFRQQVDRTVAELENARRENQVRMSEGYKQMTDALGGDVAAAVTRAKQFRENEKLRKQEIYHAANSDLLNVDNTMQGMDRSKETRFANSKTARLFLGPLATFENMFRYLGKRSAYGEGRLFNMFVRPYMEHAHNEWQHKKAGMDAMDNKAQELFGYDWIRLGEKMRDADKFPPITVSFWDNNNYVTRELRQDEAVYLYCVSKMRDGRMKLEPMGIDENTINQMVQQLDPNLVKLADWYQHEFLPKQRDRYNQVYERMFGTSMAHIDNYIHLNVLDSSIPKNEEIGDAAMGQNMPRTITGSLKERKTNVLPIDIHTSLIDLAMDQHNQMEHWAEWAEYGRDLKDLINYNNFKAKVKNMSSVEYGSGEDLLKEFRNAVAIATGDMRSPGLDINVDSKLGDVAKAVSSAKITLRSFTALKQTLSFPAFMSDARPGDLIFAASNAMGSIEWAMSNLPGFAKRWQSRQVGDTRLMETDSDAKIWKRRFVNNAVRIGLTPNAAVDCMTVAIGARGVYLTAKRRYLSYGYTDEQAERKALQDAAISYNSSQQSSEGAFTSKQQVDRSLLSIATTVFRNASMGYERRLTTGMRNLNNMRKSGYREDVIENTKKQMMEEGLTEEQAQRAAERVYNRMKWHSMMDVVNYGFLLPFFWNLGPAMIYILGGDDGDEKKNLVADCARHAIFGPIEGLTFGGLTSELSNHFLGSMVADGKTFRETINALQYRSMNPLPLYADVQGLWTTFGKDFWGGMTDLTNLIAQGVTGVNPETVTDMGVALLDACEGDLGLAKETGFFLMRLANMPKSQVDKIYMDELGIGSDEASKMSWEELAKRYARYNARKDAPIAAALLSDEAEAGREEKYIDKFWNRVKEKLEKASDDELQRVYGRGDEQRKMVAKETAKRAGLDGDRYGGKPDKNTKPETAKAMETYQRMRSYTDMADDILLQKAKADAAAAGDKDRANAIEKELSKITDLRNGKDKRVGMGSGDRERDKRILEQIREVRRKALDKYGLK